MVLGAGGHGKVVVDLLQRSEGPEPVAVLDPDPALHGDELLGVPVAGGDERLDGFDPGEVVLANGVGSVRDTTRRREVYRRQRDRGFRFATLLHPRADVAASAELGEGTQVMSGGVVCAGAVVGANGIVNTGSVVEHDCRVGDHVHVATGAVAAGAVTLGDGVHLGAGATVIQEVEVGAGTVVGAGAVVTRDLPAGVVAVGVPAHVVGKAEGP